MNISAETVKILRERTGAGMMECKKALVEAGGDLDAAAELMRKQGLAKADKKAARVAAEGMLVLTKSDDGKAAALVEVNCETDFVARGDDFVGFATAVGAVAIASRPKDIDALAALKLPSGETVDERRRALVAKIGENITLRRYTVVTAPSFLGAYLHGDKKSAALVAIEGGEGALAHQLAMHVTAASPSYLSVNDVPAEIMAKEREIETAKAIAEGKPADIVAKMIEGRLRKSFNEQTLLGQAFVIEPDVTVEKLLAKHQAKVVAFERFKVGEGIEKKKDDFVGEVMAQVKSSAGSKH
jgi:elongation factor Ts